MKVTGLCAVMAAVMAATTTFAAPLPTGLEAAGVAVAMAEDGEAILAASAGVAVSFHGENITLEQKENSCCRGARGCSGHGSAPGCGGCLL